MKFFMFFLAEYIYATQRRISDYFSDYFKVARCSTSLILMFFAVLSKIPPISFPSLQKGAGGGGVKVLKHYYCTTLALQH